MKKIIQLLPLAIVLVIGAISCKKESFNINKNPNDVTDSSIVYNFILPTAQNSTARLVTRNWGWLQNYLGYWARSGTYAPNTAEETYELTTNFQAQIWTNIYDNLYDYEAMRISAKKEGAEFYEGISRIMKAHNNAILVDIYNNVPYTEALKGAANITPKYDKGIDIYKDLLRQIDTGIALIKAANVADDGPNKTIATDDIMFGSTLFDDNADGSADPAAMKVRWAKFANTVKLRILTKFMNGGVAANPAGTVGTPESYVAGVDLGAEFATIAAEGSGFMDNGLNAEVQPGYQSDKGNPFYNSYVADNAGTKTANADYYKANSYAIDYYEYNGDPREGKFYTQSPTGFRGVQYGLPSLTENAASTLSGIGTGLARSVTSAAWVLTEAESYFLQAECIHRGFLPGGAAGAAATMNQGIQASFTYLGAGSASGYISGNATYADVDYNAASRFGGAAGGLFTIISQKWFALNGIAPFEVWSDYRRVDYSSTVNHFVYGTSTGFDAGPPISVSPANTKTEIPVRLLYPQNEYLYNPANVGADPPVGAYPFSHIFWDLN